jgi:rod shape-determining protein MreD
MRWRALAVAGLAVVVAVVLQGALLARLSIPVELLPLTVVALATRLSQAEAASIGFAGGLLADLVPPSPGVLGGNALVCTLLGVAAARTYPRIPRVWWARAVFVGVLGSCATAALVVLALIVGRPELSWSTVWPTLLGELVLGSLLGAGLVPLAAVTVGPGPRTVLGASR